MPVDLEISNLGDLVFTGGRDLSVVTASDCLRQRMMVRLRLQKGSWRYNKALGSELQELLKSGASADARNRVSVLVTQALRPMTDISVMDVEVKDNENTPRTLSIVVQAQARIDSSDLTPVRSTPFTAEFEIPDISEPASTILRVGG